MKLTVDEVLMKLRQILSSFDMTFYLKLNTCSVLPELINYYNPKFPKVALKLTTAIKNHASEYDNFNALFRNSGIKKIDVKTSTSKVLTCIFFTCQFLKNILYMVIVT